MEDLRRVGPRSKRLRRIGDLLDAALNLAGIAMVMDLQDENTQLRVDQEEQHWLTTASIPATRSAPA